MEKGVRFNFFEASYSPPKMVQAAVAAEKNGFDSVMIGDHFLDLSGLVKVDPWTVLAYIGSKTKKIRLMTYVTDVIRTHPAKVAHLAATLDELTGGRVTLGLGAGESMNLVPFGIGFEEPTTRLARLREGIQVIRMLLESSKDKKVDFEGNYFTLCSAWLQQLPIQRPLPIGIGALGSSSSLNLIGEVGDAWLPAYSSPDLFNKRVQIIKERAKSFRRDPNSIRYYASVLGVMSSDRKVIERAVDAYRGLILSLAPKQVSKMANLDPLINLGYDYQHLIPGDSLIEQMEETVRRIPDQVVEDFLVIGTANDVTERISGYKKAGATDIIFWDMVAEGLMDSLTIAVKNMKIMHEKVMVHFR